LPVSKIVLQDVEKGLDQWFSKFFSHSPLTNPNIVNSSFKKVTKTIAKISHYLDIIPGVF